MHCHSMPHRRSALVAALGLASVVAVGLPSFALPRRGATLALGGLGEAQQCLVGRMLDVVDVSW